MFRRLKLLWNFTRKHCQCDEEGEIRDSYLPAISKLHQELYDVKWKAINAQNELNLLKTLLDIPEYKITHGKHDEVYTDVHRRQEVKDLRADGFEPLKFDQSLHQTVWIKRKKQKQGKKK